MGDYWESILTLALVYGILATALNIPFGFGGVYNAAQGALFGAGGYAAALVALHWTDDFFVATAVAIGAAALAGCALVIPAAKARHEYFMITSLGLQVVASTYFVTSETTGGNDGLVGIPQASLFGTTLTGTRPYLYLALGGLAVTVFVAWIFKRSSAGRRLAAVRDDEVAAQSLAITPLKYRAIGLVLGAALSGVGGSIFAFNAGFINPESFGLSLSILIFTMVILGGAGTLSGPIIGALVLTFLPACLTYLEIVPDNKAGVLQQIVYGALLVVMVIFRPEGLVGGKSPGKSLPSLSRLATRKA